VTQKDAGFAAALGLIARFGHIQGNHGGILTS